jgi:uncharacterized membrane protein YidH (DUF202 family)
MPAPESDTTLATDRTALAWQRVAIASVAVAIVIVRQGIVYGLLGLAIPLAVLLLAAATLEWSLSVSERLSSSPRNRQVAALTGLIMTLAGGATVLAIAG